MSDPVTVSATVRVDMVWPKVDLESLRVKAITTPPRRKKHVNDDVPVVKEYAPSYAEYNAVIDEIVNLLPHRSIWPLSGKDDDKYETDYPTVTREMLLEAGSDRSPINKRAVWIIGNMVFLKRNEDTTSLINVGHFKSPAVSQHPYWDQGFVIDTWKALFALRDLIKSRHPSNITQADVLQLINLKI